MFLGGSKMITLKGLGHKKVLIIVFSVFIVVGLLFYFPHMGKVKASAPIETGLQELYSEQLKMGYYLYIPEGYNAKQKTKYPLIMHLHGANATGNGKNELLKVKSHGLKSLLHNASERDCLVLAPQAKSRWKDDELDKLLDEVTSTYSIDINRIYLTGVSMGGYGAWSYAVNGNYKLAALVPICGFFHISNEVVNELKEMPIWLFHGEKDKSVNVGEAYQAIKKLEGVDPNFKYTIYENGTHTIWDEVYETSELYDWLLEQAREK